MRIRRPRSPVERGGTTRDSLPVSLGCLRGFDGTVHVAVDVVGPDPVEYPVRREHVEHAAASDRARRSVDPVRLGQPEELGHLRRTL